MKNLHKNMLSRSEKMPWQRLSTLLAGTLALALLTASLPAAADNTTPSHAQVEKARDICGMHKRKVKEMEAKGASDQALSKARLAWEDSCEHASELMTAAGMN